jgi:hypothetical protein
MRIDLVIGSQSERRTAAPQLPTPLRPTGQQALGCAAFQFGEPFGLGRQAREEQLDKIETLVLGQRERLLEHLVSTAGHRWDLAVVAMPTRSHDAYVGAPFRDCAEGIIAHATSGSRTGEPKASTGTRAIPQRGYGFHRAHGLIAMIKLCCSGIHLYLVHSGRDPPRNLVENPKLPDLCLILGRARTSW